MSPTLTGTCFAFDVPAAWTTEANDGLVTATSDESVAGFTPNVVLREWRVKRPVRSSLARASWANLREISRKQTVLHVEAIPDRKANGDIRERRRLWAFSAPDATRGDAESPGLLTIRDLLISGKALAELTVTAPWRSWHRGDTHETILNSLRPLPRKERGIPREELTADVLLCDEWAERRDDAPRENLEILEPPELQPVIPHSPWRAEPVDTAPVIPCLSTEVVELPEKAFKAFNDLALLDRSAKKTMLTYTGWKLVRAGLTGWDGVVTELGARVARHLQNGRHLTLQVKGSSPRLLTFWIDGPSALAVLSFICPYTASDRSALGFCPTERIPRVLLELIGFHPSWDMRFRYTVTRHALLAKLLADIPPSTATRRDAVAFSAQPWVPMSLLDPDGEPALTWVMTPHRGAAILRNRADEDEITVTSNPRRPFWELLLDASMRLAREGSNS